MNFSCLKISVFKAEEKCGGMKEKNWETSEGKPSEKEEKIEKEENMI